MIEFKQIKNRWLEKDSKISDDLSKESIRIPNIHAIYLDGLKQLTRQYYQLEKQFKQLYRKRYDYYLGRLSEEEIEKENWETDHIRRGKTEIVSYLDSDNYILDKKYELKEIENQMNFLEKVLKQISDRTWQIKNAIEYQKFMSGI